MEFRRRHHKKKLPNLLQRLHGHGKEHVRRRPYILPILGLLLGGSIVAAVVFAHGGHTLQSSDLHIVYLSDGTKRQTLDTNAKTVGELINRLPLHLIPQDVVEPSRSTKIVEDNFRVNVYRARPVTVIVNGQKIVTITAQKSARVVAVEAGAKIYPEDGVSFGVGTLKENILGEKVIIAPSTPLYLNLYGTPLSTRTQATSVEGLLQEKHIKLGKGDKVKPALDTPITPHLQVFVTRKGVKITSVEETIPAPTQIIPDASLSLGASVVRQVGSPGKRAVTYELVIKNGKVVGKKIIQQAIIQDAIPQIIARGTVVQVNGDKTSLMAAAGISGGDYGYVNYVISHESNWNPAAYNGGGCAGLGQACPGGKLAYACPGWQNNPVCQLRYFTNYASKYGGWGGAYSYWVSHGYW